jgi:hypothetical protein
MSGDWKFPEVTDGQKRGLTRICINEIAEGSHIQKQNLKVLMESTINRSMDLQPRGKDALGKITRHIHTMHPSLSERIIKIHAFKYIKECRIESDRQKETASKKKIYSTTTTQLALNPRDREVKSSFEYSEQSVRKSIRANLCCVNYKLGNSKRCIIYDDKDGDAKLQAQMLKTHADSPFQSVWKTAKIYPLSALSENEMPQNTKA